MRNFLLFYLSLFSFVAQAQNEKIVVNHRGVLHEIMMEQKIGANAALDDFKKTPNLYALGALKGLTGEILIMNGDPVNSFSKGKEIIFDRSFSKEATLLVYSTVKTWTRVDLNLNTSGLMELQSIINQEALKAGIDINKAFPFLIKGKLSQIEWHIINATEAKEQSHEAFKKAGLKGVSNEIDAQILGFYSQNHEGVFTHRGSFLHMHFIDKEETKMGHVDNLKVNGTISLFFPNIK